MGWGVDMAICANRVSEVTAVTRNYLLLIIALPRDVSNMHFKMLKIFTIPAIRMRYRMQKKKIKTIVDYRTSCTSIFE
jgi:hypothetical protein